VAMNPIIKFTTLFGLLAVEMAVGLKAQGHQTMALTMAALFLMINLIFVYRNFYGMRITVAVPDQETEASQEDNAAEDDVVTQSA